MLASPSRHRWTAAAAAFALLVGLLAGGSLTTATAVTDGDTDTLVLPDLCVSPVETEASPTAAPEESPSASASEDVPSDDGPSESAAPSSEASPSPSEASPSPSESAPESTETVASEPVATEAVTVDPDLRAVDEVKGEAVGDIADPSPAETPVVSDEPASSPPADEESSAPVTDEPTAVPSASVSGEPTDGPSPSVSYDTEEPTDSGVCPEPVAGASAASGNNSVTVSWSPSLDESTRYVVQVVGEDRLVWIEALASSVTVSGLRNGVEYGFVVYAVNDLGRSVASDVVLATPSTGMEGEVAGLIVAFEDGVSVSSGQGSVPGEAAVDDVDLTMDGQVAEGIHTVELSEAVSLETAQRIADELEADGAVAWAEPDQFVFTSSVDGSDAPTDALYADGQWNLWDTYGVGIGSGPTGMTAAYSPEAGSGATVAVIDTGITDHPDLRGQLAPGYDFVSDPEGLAAVRRPGEDPVSFDGDGVSGWDADPTDPGDWRGVPPVRDSSWHGTQVAGVIAAAGNTEGVVGIVPGAKLQPVRALSWRGGLMSDIASSITWASGGAVDGAPLNANPADVINLSFAVQASCSLALQSAISGAVERGSVVVAAAGNAGSDVSGFAPANCADVIAVGATGRDGKRAPYSNFGEGIDVSAPGGAGTGSGGVLSTSNTGTTTPDAPGYRASEGTSIAAAHVAAAAAYLAGADPELTPAQIRERITGKDAVRAFAGDACDSDPGKTCGDGIIYLAQIMAAGVPGIDVNLSVNVSGTDTLIADGSTVANGDTVTVGSAGLLSPGVGDREIRTTLDPRTVYTPGSAVAPEGWTINYSADNGTNWTASEPSPATSITDVRATKTDVAAGLIEGTSQIYSSETTSAIPSNNFSASTGGDGWDTFFYEDYVFNIFHHSDATVLDCHYRSSGDRCTGYKATFSGYRAGMRSGGWVDSTTGRLYALTAQTSTSYTGALCIDVSQSSGPVSCGFIRMSPTMDSVNSYNYLTESVNIGRRFFGIAYGYNRSTSQWEPQLMCYDAALSAVCANSPVSLISDAYSVESLADVRPLAVGERIFAKTSKRIYCYMAATMTECDNADNWPVTISNRDKTPVAPHTTTTGTLDGICYEDGCFDFSGVSQPTWDTPFKLTSYSNQNWAMHAVTGGLGGTRYFWAAQPLQVYCFDYATNAACTGGFPKNFSGYNLIYSTKPDPENDSCIWVNSDAGRISVFDAQSGDNGCAANPVITLQPSQFAPRYACSTTAGISEWTALRLVSISGGGSASSVALTVRTATGSVVPGWSSVPVTLGADLDMTGLDPAVSGSRPTFSFAFSGVTGTVSTAVIALDYKGKGPELCVDTVATSASPPEDASVTGALTENLGLEESFSQTRTFRIGTTTAVVEETVPGAPTIVSGSGLNTTASVVFRAPSDNGGLPITSYAISTDSGSSWSTASEVDNGDGTYTVTVTGLTPGTTYGMRLAAVNDMGRGASASVSVTAQLLSIGSLVNTPVNQGPLTLASTTGGGLPLTYTSSSESICTVSGVTVTLATEGLCELVAHQAGDATADPIILPAETPGSFTVLPAYYEPTVPGAPTGLTLTPGDGQIGLSWTAPTDDGHSDLTDYVVQYKLGGSWIPLSDGVSTGTTALMAGLTNGTEYSFRVAAVNAVGTGPYTSTSTATPATTPGAPTSLSATMSGTTVAATWTAPASTGGSAITDYRVQYKLSTEGDWTTFTDGVSSTTGASITGLTDGADYDVQVTTINAVGAGDATSTVNLTVTPGSGQATLAWAAPASPGGTITDYEVQYRESSSDPWTTFVDGVSTTTGGTVTGLTNGTRYYFRVATIVDDGVSMSPITSSYTSVVAGTPRTTPSAPSITASPGNRQIQLSWSTPDSGGSTITDYVIQYKATSGSTWTTLVDGTSAVTSATVTSLTNGTSFDFRVASTNVVGTSSYSSTASATPRTTPDAPTGVSVTVGDGTASLTWTAPVDTGGAVLTNYVVQYKTASGYVWSTVSRAASTTASQLVTGLTNGTPYVFKVAAVNAAGAGTYATAVSGTPVTTPGMPRSLAVTVAGTSAIVSWLAPISDGGSSITDYEVDYRLTTDSTWTSWTHSASAATSATLTGLTGLASGARYDVRVRTVTSVGTSSGASTTFPAVESSGGSSGGSPGGSSGGSTDSGSGSPATPPVEPVAPPSIADDEEGLVLIDGVLMSLDITPPGAGGSSWQVAGPDFSMEFTPQPVAGSNQLVGATQGMRSPVGGWIDVAGDGYQGGTQVKVYAVPRPKTRLSLRATSAVFLGLVDVQPDGSFDIRVTLPPAVQEGDYVLQVNGLSPESSVRSVNMALNVYDMDTTVTSDSPEPRAVVSQLKSRAFFAARSAKLSPLGVKRLKKFARTIPRDARDVEVRVTGVSIGLDSFSDNLALAAKRANRVVTYLRKRGIAGTYTVNVTATEGFGGPTTTPDALAKRKRPFTTATITYSARP